MKNVKLILAIAILFLGMGNVSAQDKIPQTVVIRVFEFIMGAESKMIITEPSGNSNTIGLKSLDMRKGEGIASNQVTIQAELNKWKKEGFEVDAVSIGSVGDAPMTLIILSKDK